jgi:hypothetical protein
VYGRPANAQTKPRGFVPYSRNAAHFMYCVSGLTGFSGVPLFIPLRFFVPFLALPALAAMCFLLLSDLPPWGEGLLKSLWGFELTCFR